MATERPQRPPLGSDAPSSSHSAMVQGSMYATAITYPSTAHLAAMAHAAPPGRPFAAAGPVSRRPIFGTCPFCLLSIYTVTRERSGPMTYCASASMGIAGALPGVGLAVAFSAAWALLIPAGVVACAAVPFMRCARLRNIAHHCPHCDNVVAIYNRF